MTDCIETPKMSEILSEEFMLPMGISAYKLAKDINVQVSRIQDILHDRRRVSADTAVTSDILRSASFHPDDLIRFQLTLRVCFLPIF